MITHMCIYLSFSLSISISICLFLRLCVCLPLFRHYRNQSALLTTLFVIEIHWINNNTLLACTQARVHTYARMTTPHNNNHMQELSCANKIDRGIRGEKWSNHSIHFFSLDSVFCCCQFGRTWTLSIVQSLRCHWCLRRMCVLVFFLFNHIRLSIYMLRHLFSPQPVFCVLSRCCMMAV